MKEEERYLIPGLSVFVIREGPFMDAKDGFTCHLLYGGSGIKGTDFRSRKDARIAIHAYAEELLKGKIEDATARLSLLKSSQAKLQGGDVWAIAQFLQKDE